MHNAYDFLRYFQQQGDSSNEFVQFLLHVNLMSVVLLHLALFAVICFVCLGPCYAHPERRYRCVSSCSLIIGTLVLIPGLALLVTELRQRCSSSQGGPECGDPVLFAHLLLVLQIALVGWAPGVAWLYVGYAFHRKARETNINHIQRRVKRIIKDALKKGITMKREDVSIVEALRWDDDDDNDDDSLV